MRVPVIIAFGANMDPLQNLHRGLSSLHEAITLTGISTVWRTAPLPNPDLAAHQQDLGGDYLNGAAISSIRMEPKALKKILRDVEARCRRVRVANSYAPRPLDLDIVMMGQEAVSGPDLTLPDPDLVSRPFVAIPSAELAPDLIHPVEKVRLEKLAQRFDPQDTGMVADAQATDLLRSII